MLSLLFPFGNLLLFILNVLTTWALSLLTYEYLNVALRNKICFDNVLWQLLYNFLANPLV